MFTSLRTLSRPAKLFLLVVFLDGLFFSGWNLFLNLYFLEKGYSKEVLGLINSIPSLSMLVFTIPMGMISDRIDRRLAMFLGFLFSTLAMTVQIFVRDRVLILLMGALWGPMASLYMLSQAPFMMRVSTEYNRDLLFSLSFGMFPLAGALGNLFYGQLPGLYEHLLKIPSGSAASYQAVVLTSLLLSLSALVPMLFIRWPQEGSPAADERTPTGSTVKPLQVLLRPLTLKLAVPNLLIGFGAATLIPYMNVFFSERFQMDDATLGALFSISSLMTGAACFVGPRLVGNLGGKVRTVVLGQGLSLGFLLLLGFAPWVMVAAIGFLVRGVLMNMVTPLFDAFAMEQTPSSEQGAVNSVRSLAWNVGWAVGPFLSGVVQQRYGFAPLFVSTALLYAVAILLTWGFFGGVKTNRTD